MITRILTLGWFVCACCSLSSQTAQPHASALLEIIKSSEHDTLKQNQVLRNTEGILYSVHYYKMNRSSKLAVIIVRESEQKCSINAFLNDNSEWTFLQQIVSVECGVEQKIEFVHFNGGSTHGFTLRKNDFSYLVNLFLFDNSLKIFHRVPDFDRFGYLTYVASDSLFYTYNHCGCADACWVSRLCMIDDLKVKILHHVRGNCYNLLVGKGDYHEGVQEISSSLEPFQPKDKFRLIDDKWKAIILEEGY